MDPQIADAWAKRSYQKHSISKLTDSDAEVNETEHWADIAYDCGYIKQEDQQGVFEFCQEIGRLLGSMIKKADAFCNPAQRKEMD